MSPSIDFRGGKERNQGSRHEPFLLPEGIKMLILVISRHRNSISILSPDFLKTLILDFISDEQLFLLNTYFNPFFGQKFLFYCKVFDNYNFKLLNLICFFGLSSFWVFFLYNLFYPQYLWRTYIPLLVKPRLRYCRYNRVSRKKPKRYDTDNQR